MLAETSCEYQMALEANDDREVCADFFHHMSGCNACRLPLAWSTSISRRCPESCAGDQLRADALMLALAYRSLPPRSVPVRLS